MNPKKYYSNIINLLDITEKLSIFVYPGIISKHLNNKDAWNYSSMHLLDIGTNKFSKVDGFRAKIAKKLLKFLINGRVLILQPAVKPS